MPALHEKLHTYRQADKTVLQLPVQYQYQAHINTIIQNGLENKTLKRQGK